MNFLIQKILDGLISKIENNDVKWRKSWATLGGMPQNAITGREYQGINVLLLWANGQERNFTSNKWATLKQWGGAGYRVKDSEIKRNTPIIFYKMLEKKDGSDEAKTYPMMRASWVFNSDQLEAYDAGLPVRNHTIEERHLAAAQWFDSSGIKVLNGNPAYRPSTGECFMPFPSCFDTLDDYWTTMFHEAIHWTSHPTRLDRKTASFMIDTEGYAFEELIAELGAAFMDARFGIEAHDIHEQHGAYLQNWLKHIKTDDKRKLLVSAAKQATAAYQYLVKEEAATVAEAA